MKFDDIIKLVEDNPYSAFFYTPNIYKKAVSYVFKKPVETISVSQKDEIDFAFKAVQKLIGKKYYGYTLIEYEAGFLFEQKLTPLLRDENKKLIQFFFFDKSQTQRIKSSKIIFDNPSTEKYSITDFELSRTENEFIEDIRKIKHYIKEGDTYQVNYTIKGKFNFSGSHHAFFQKLLFNQSAKYSAFINNEKNFIISLSPELFFNKKGREILSHPMKGTIRRGFNHNSDKTAENELKRSEKNLAENVMIVDLIRNDLGRICRYGSIKTPKLFKIEKYESLFQMVSKVQGELIKKTSFKDIITNIFPCGSVTGAPKIRTMEIINEIEKEDRGIYTGSIGLFTPKEIELNVAIRTISINKKSGNGIIGLGSGIVWDSNPKSEYEEVQLKSKFLTEPLDYFEIFETMKSENGSIRFLDDHIKRMKLAADYFLFKFSEKKVRKYVEQLVVQIETDQQKKIKLLLNKLGKFRAEVSDISKPMKNVSIILSEHKVSSTDKFRHFKTTNRKIYDDEYEKYSKQKFREVIFLNEKDEIVEGSRTNIFIRIGNTWFTPSLSSGALPGVYRNYFLQNHPEALQQQLNLTDLVKADQVILTNAVQGEIKVSRIYLTSDEFITFN
ncbi:MAG: aminodeoxychorismate synthase component I [bacterium]|nr:aminodeoxychorismate synthase component I [bacterium]